MGIHCTVADFSAPLMLGGREPNGGRNGKGFFVVDGVADGDDVFCGLLVFPDGVVVNGGLVVGGRSSADKCVLAGAGSRSSSGAGAGAAR